MLAALTPGKWIVILGMIAGGGSLILQIARGDSVYRAFVEGLGVDFGVMVVAGVSKRFWRGDEVDEASAGGIGVKLVEATQEPIQALNDRIDAQVGGLEERVYELEREREREREQGDS